jgi:hypothetical protein
MLAGRAAALFHGLNDLVDDHPIGFTKISEDAANTISLTIEPPTLAAAHESSRCINA